jgi:hypothetical protein
LFCGEQAAEPPAKTAKLGGAIQHDVQVSIVC